MFQVLVYQIATIIGNVISAPKKNCHHDITLKLNRAEGRVGTYIEGALQPPIREWPASLKRHAQTYEEGEDQRVWRSMSALRNK